VTRDVDRLAGHDVAAVEGGAVMKDLLRTADLSRDDLELVLRLAKSTQTEPRCYRHLLDARIVVHYFAKPSTRTRLALQAAVASLGGLPVVVGPSELHLGRGETIEDTARVMSRYAAAITVRTFAHDEVERFAAAATVPVVNALTDKHHPCQSLADLLTIRNRFGRHGAKVAYIGDGNNVANSLIEACALAGLDITVATPPGFEPEPGLAKESASLATDNGGSLTLTHDPLLAAADAQVVYTDVWLSMGDSDREREIRRLAFAGYGVDTDVMAVAAPDAMFLHCLPAHREEEVAASVIDGPHSRVFDQAENRMHTSRALLIALYRGLLSGRGARDLVEVS
jgi:ornithine carbamoyltransferase